LRLDEQEIKRVLDRVPSPRARGYYGDGEQVYWRYDGYIGGARR
jgi:hypothetical protein